MVSVSRRRILPKAADPSRDRLLLQLHAAQDIPQFWLALQPLLASVVPYDALVVYLNFLDFAKTWKAARILATPNAQKDIDWFQGRHEVDMTPRFVMSQPRRVKLYRLSDVFPHPDQMHTTRFFRDYFAANGWEHVAVCLYWRGASVASEVALRRTPAQGDFTDDELVELQNLYPHIETVLHRLLAQEEDRAQRHCLQQFNHHLPFALLYLSWELQPLFANHEAQAQCAQWNFGPGPSRAYNPSSVFHPPAEIIAGCNALKAHWLERQALQLRNPSPIAPLRLSHPRHPDLQAMLTIQADAAHLTANPGFAVYLENRSATRSDRVPPPSIMERLSPTERELVRQVCGGLSNHEIAGRLKKSIKTVKGQLSRIYRKLGVDSRARLMALCR